MTFQLSHHTAGRARSRGVPDNVIESILNHFDIDHGVGGGCRVLRLSKYAAQEASTAVDCPSLAGALMRIVLVENQLTGKIVTVMRDLGGQKSRRYRRSL